MTYILKVMGGEKFIITEEQKNGVMQALSSGLKVIEINGEIVPLAPVPSVVRFERWFTQENERLRLTGRRLCKQCFSVMEIETGCTCWGRNGGKDKHAFVLPQSVMSQLSIRAFPELSLAEQAKVDFESQTIEPVEYIEENNILGYIDSETGEKLFS
jgi:hypothetical protein